MLKQEDDLLVSNYARIPAYQAPIKKGSSSNKGKPSPQQYRIKAPHHPSVCHIGAPKEAPQRAGAETSNSGRAAGRGCPDWDPEPAQLGGSAGSWRGGEEEGCGEAGWIQRTLPPLKIQAD